MIISTPSRLLILSCSMTKRPGPERMPARDRYDGPLWRTLRHVDPYQKKAAVAFVSARYGFRQATPSIERYDSRMTPEIAARMKAGGLGTRWPRPESQRNVMPAGEHAGIHIASMTRYGMEPFGDICLVGGAIYVDVMRHFVRLFRDRGHVTSDARIIEICAPIGVMRQQMTAWLNVRIAGGGP